MDFAWKNQNILKDLGPCQTTCICVVGPPPKNYFFGAFSHLLKCCDMWDVTLPEIVFVPMSQSHAWLWHVSCDIAWNSLWANVTIIPLVVAWELWHYLEQSLGQCHNQTPDCDMWHVTLSARVFGPMSQSHEILIVRLAQRLFQAMSQLTCHNQAAALYPINSKDVRLIFIRFSSHFHKIFVSSLFSLWSLFYYL